MKCPTCDYEMSPKGSSTSYNSTLRKTYLVKKFTCKRDDVWIELQEPKPEEE